jgi:hypothetical protein
MGSGIFERIVLLRFPLYARCEIIAAAEETQNVKVHDMAKSAPKTNASTGQYK